MPFDLEAKIAQLQQRISQSEATGGKTGGLRRKLAKLLRRRRPGAGSVANGVAAAALTLGIAGVVGSALVPDEQQSTASGNAASSGAAGSGTPAGSGLVFGGVTIADASPASGAGSSASGGTASTSPSSAAAVASAQDSGAPAPAATDVNSDITLADGPGSNPTPGDSAASSGSPDTIGQTPSDLPADWTLFGDDPE